MIALATPFATLKRFAMLLSEVDDAAYRVGDALLGDHLSLTDME
jgi:hypothetical protein